MKRRDRVLERRHRPSQAQLQARDAAQADRVRNPVQRRGVDAQARLELPHLANAVAGQGDGVYLTYRQLAAYLQFTGKRAPEAARKWFDRNRKNGVRRVWRGAAWLIVRADVDAVLAGRRLHAVSLPRSA